MTLALWQVDARRITYEDRWLKVVTDTCRAADGRLLGDFHTLAYPDWVSVIALTDEGKVVLVREYRHARREIVLGLPGGMVDASDEAPLLAAQRELREETGHTAERWVSLGKSAVNAATHTNLLWSFLAVGARPTASPSWDASEEIEITEVDLAALAHAELQSLHLATLLLAERFLLADRSEQLRGVRTTLLEALTGRA
jgi:ADP-ribose pyrophosphatase